MKEDREPGFTMGSFLKSFVNALFSDRKKPGARQKEKGVVYVPLMSVSSARKVPMNAGEKA